MYLAQYEFVCSASEPFTKNNSRIRKFKEIGDSRFISRNELDKDCYRNDMAYDT